jgi:hypothetical protein
MIGGGLPSAKFFQDLLEADQRELRREQRSGCPWCRGRLDRSDYPRKPRGLPVGLGLDELFGIRFSLCCARDGCRRRLTPPSVRFLGRRVYVGAVVMLAATASLAVALITYQVARRTIQRWSRWWTQALPGTPFWQVAQARFAEPVDEAGLPGSLVARFHGDRETALLGALRFVAPITTTSARSSFAMGP